MIQVENIFLPNKPLNNFELEEAVKKLNIKNFRGVFMRDQLPKKARKIECGIINLDDEGNSPPGSKGTHWTCWKKNNKEIIYFDSFGIQPPLEIINYLGSDITYSNIQLQEPHQVICGHLCLFILHKKEPLEKVIKDILFHHQ